MVCISGWFLSHLHSLKALWQDGPLLAVHPHSLNQKLSRPSLFPSEYYHPGNVMPTAKSSACIPNSTDKAASLVVNPEIKGHIRENHRKPFLLRRESPNLVFRQLHDISTNSFNPCITVTRRNLHLLFLRSMPTTIPPVLRGPKLWQATYRLQQQAEQNRTSRKAIKTKTNTKNKDTL